MKRTITRLLIILLLTAPLVACSQETFEALTPAQLLDLGERFLLEGNYEQAVIHFTRLIEIEPMNSRGYIGLARAYLGLGNPGRAREVLEQGREQVPDDTEIGDMLDEMQPAAPASEVDELLSGFAALISAGNPEAVAERMTTDEVWRVIGEASQEFGLPYIIDTTHGRIGIYNTNHGFKIYHGDFSGDSREGFGTWIGRNYIAEGQWSGDMPNGQFSERRVGRGPIIGSGLLVKLDALYTGNVVNGLWHGDVAMSSNDGYSLTLHFDMGRVTVFYYVIGGTVVMTYVGFYDRLGDRDRMEWLEEWIDMVWGISGFVN